MRKVHAHKRAGTKTQIINTQINQLFCWVFEFEFEKQINNQIEQMKQVLENFEMLVVKVVVVVISQLMTECGKRGYGQTLTNETVSTVVEQ